MTVKRPFTFSSDALFVKFKRTLEFDILFTSVKVARTCTGRKLKEGMYEGIHDRKLKEHF